MTDMSWGFKYFFASAGMVTFVILCMCIPALLGIQLLDPTGITQSVSTSQPVVNISSDSSCERYYLFDLQLYINLNKYTESYSKSNSWIIIPPKLGDPVFKCPRCGHKTLSPNVSCENCGKMMLFHKDAPVVKEVF